MDRLSVWAEMIDSSHVTGRLPAHPDGDPAPEPVVLGGVDESFHQVAGGVVHETLLRLGHRVEVRVGPHPEMYPLLGRGEVHLFATSWLPGGHGAYWPTISGRAVQVAPLYEGARFFWAVPDYVPADEVASLADLTRPEVVQRMATLDIQGTTPGAGLTLRSQQVVRDYGLDRVGWRYEVGGLAEIVQTVEAGIAAHEWFVTPLWEPQYLNDIHALRPLADPLSVFPQPDTAWLTGNRGAVDRLPVRTRGVLRRIRLSVSDISAMDYAVNRGGVAILDAGRKWMQEHPQEVAAWFA